MQQIKINDLKDIAKKKAGKVISERKDVIAVFLVGSIARELLALVPKNSNVYEYSDMDLVVILSGQNKDIFSYKKSAELPLTGYCINYYSLDAFEERRKKEWFIFDKLSNWINEAIPLYDPNNLLTILKNKYGRWDNKIRKQLLDHLYNFAKLDLSDAFCFFEKGQYILSLWALRQSQSKILERDLIEKKLFRFSPKVNIYLTDNKIKKLIISTESLTIDYRDKAKTQRLCDILFKTEEILKNHE